MTKKNILCAMLFGACAGLGSSGSALAAADGPWLARLRALHIDPVDDSSPIAALGVPRDDIHVSKEWTPEIDLSYFLTPNIALELIAATAKHDVKISSLGLDIGSFRHIPPTLTLQYHFLPDGVFRPYVGAGVNYTRIASDHLAVPGVGRLDVDKNSWGGALQVGADIKVADNLYLNIDVKKVYIKTDVSLGGTKLTTVKVDPILIGVGLGMRF